MTYRTVQKTKGGSFTIVIPSLMIENLGLKPGDDAELIQTSEGILIKKKQLFADVENGLKLASEQLAKELLR